ncbi:tRNA(Ile)-lysidine synthase TilS/MesJ [Lachnospiraceae bacterium G11]|nr:tRNA(Ile)-lysidine synthase TilS/MesJ [Lachnospiraceae bacterium G11]
MKIQQLYSVVRKAIDEFEMIDEGDKIAIGISGGKDSLTLLYALAGIRKFYPKKFDIIAITVDLGFGNLNLEEIKKLCNELEVEYKIVETEIADIVFNQRKESSPCSLCAKMRKGALNDAIKECGCNKVAYAHHKDDVVATMMMSLIYEGRFHTFRPITYLDRSELTVIRPFIYMDEADVIGFVNKYKVPVVKSPCPVDGITKRQYVSDLIASINRETPGVKNRMFAAIKDYPLDGWTRKRNGRQPL